MKKNLNKGHGNLHTKNTNFYNKLNIMLSCYCYHYMVCSYLFCLLFLHKSGY